MLSVKLFIVHPLPKMMPFKQHSQTLWRRGRFPCAICYDFAGFCVVSANILIGMGLCTLNRFHSGNLTNGCSGNDIPWVVRNLSKGARAVTVRHDGAQTLWDSLSLHRQPTSLRHDGLRAKIARLPCCCGLDHHGVKGRRNAPLFVTASLQHGH